MADLEKTAAVVNQVSGLAAAILTAIPGGQSIGAIEVLLTQLVIKALLAYKVGLGVEVTPENILKLLPDQTPLVEPRG